MSLAIFPLHAIRSDGTCGCGDPKCRTIGKHPRYPYSQLGIGEQIPHDGNYGVATGQRSGIFVVDIDTEEALETFLATYDVPETLVVKTGRGWQFYFQWPGFPVRNSISELGKKIDIRGDGGFVVGPGSMHKSGVIYEVVEDRDPAPAPAALLSWPGLRGRERAERDGESKNAPIAIHEGSPEWERRLRLGREFCENAQAAVEGQGGSAALWDVAIHLVRRLELPLDACAELIQEWYNPRCSPPWTEGQISHKLEDARDKSDMPTGIAPETWAATIANLGKKKALPPEGEGGSEGGLGISWGGWDAPLPPVEYAISGIIPKSSVCMLVAHGDSLKTWAALSMAIAVARGEAWLGRFPTTKGRAIVLDYESGTYEIRRRIQLLGSEGLEGRLGSVSYPAANLFDQGLWEELVKFAPTLLVIDSLRAGSPGVDENDSRVADGLQFAGKFAEATGCAVVVIHHANKGDRSDGREKVRGSTALFAACDAIFEFVLIDEGGNQKRTCMRALKMSAGPKPQHVNLELSNKGLQWFEDETKEAAGSVGNVEALAAAFRLHIANHGPASCDEIRIKLGKKKETIANAFHLLRARGAVMVIGKKVHLDSPEAMEKRILDAIRMADMDAPELRSATALAKVANCTKEDIDDAERRKLIVKVGSLYAISVP